MSNDVNHIIAQLQDGNRTVLAKAITLVESTHPDKKVESQDLMSLALEIETSSLRLAISGSPGVGKSTFIEALGTFLTDLGHRPAVLTVDPSSSLSGGSILGDRTRMEELSKNPDVFIRQSPTSSVLGGVGRRTREIAKLCEVAGYDIIIIETVGVGQSEIIVEEMVDIFALLLLPGSGDELQAIKMGIVEIADVILVTKADGDNVERAIKTMKNYKHALSLIRSKVDQIKREVMTVSAYEKKGLEEFWSHIEMLKGSPQWAESMIEKKKNQKVAWLRSLVEEMWVDQLHNNENYKRFLTKMDDENPKQELNVYRRAWELVQKLRG